MMSKMKNISKGIIPILVSIGLVLCSCTKEATTIELIYSTDVHGSLFPYDYITDSPTNHSLAQVASYVQQVRDTAENVILLEAGDMLQGTPMVYYYNYIDTTSSHVISDIYNYMKYDAVTIGNHDIEAGHAVYDRLVSELNMPVLCANAVKTSDGTPYFKPYTILKRGNKKIAIIGLITPHIPHWLHEDYWKGMVFEDMIASAQKWVDIVKAKENPDAIIGLFHAGYDHTYGNTSPDEPMNENASTLVGERVEEFDCILIGHDHKYVTPMITTPSGRKIPLCDAGTAAHKIGHLTINFDGGDHPKVTNRLVSVEDVKPSEEYMALFNPQNEAVKAYSQRIVGELSEEIVANESLFGSSKFVDFVHRVMLDRTGADISFTAPLRLFTTIEKGKLTIGDMFKLYKYENTLNVMNLTGDEVRRYLEYSYDSWISNPDETGHLLLLDEEGKIKNQYFNFDSAAGIRYTVNPYKPYGERVAIQSMMNGSPFNSQKMYKVAINSYRFNGGGNHLESGVGLTKEQINERHVESIMTDLRELMVEALKASDKLEIPTLNNWKFVPENKLQQVINLDKCNFMK